MHRLPWWLFVIAAALAPFAVSRGLASLAPSPALTLAASTLPWLQAGAVALCLWLAGASLAARLKRRFALRAARSLAALGAIDWVAFEQLVAELFRRRDYHAFTTPAGADGGVDIIVESRDERAIVQAKHWPGRTVGAPVVREIYALLEDFDADRAIVVTSGRFSAGARRFAEAKPIELLDGEALVAAARRLRHAAGRLDPASAADRAPGSDGDGTAGAGAALPVTAGAVSTVTCPHCHTEIHLPARREL